MYTNIFDSIHPGLVIILLDKSIAMNNKYQMSTSLEIASKVIDSIYLRLINHNGTRHEVFLFLIEYGEANSIKIQKGWITDFSLKLEPLADNTSSYLDALRKVEEIIISWKNAWQVESHFDMFPVPMVINFHSGDWSGMSCSNNAIEQTNLVINKINQIDFPDGKPLICNIVVNSTYSSDFFPNLCPEDKIGACIYKASSVIPLSMKNLYNDYYTHFPLKKKLIGNERLYASNLEVDDMCNFCNSLFDLFTFEWCGMCVGAPNPLLETDLAKNS